MGLDRVVLSQEQDNSLWRGTYLCTGTTLHLPLLVVYFRCIIYIPEKEWILGCD